MLNRYLPLAAMAALLTAAATVAQPQTTTDTSTTDAASTPPATTTSETPSASSTSTPAITPSTPAGTSAASSTSTATTGTSTTASAGVAGTGQLQGQDATFLRKAIEGDRTEIASAQAALDNAQRNDTRNAARMILDDHRKSSEALQALANRKGWALPSTSASAESDQPLAGTAGGASFDDRFMADQIRMHREAIALYRAQASSGADPDLRMFARDQLPHLEHHLEMLQGSNTQK